MSKTKTQSQKARTQRRAEERKVAQAKRTIARAEQPPTPSAKEIVGPRQTPGASASAGGQHPLDIAAMYQRIGALTVERDYWYGQAQEAQYQLSALDPTHLPPEIAEQLQEATEAGEDMQAVVQAEQEARELAEEAVDDDAADQATEDAEKFPELQNTNGEVIQEEGEELSAAEEEEPEPIEAGARARAVQEAPPLPPANPEEAPINKDGTET